ncbi:HNH endonuclease [Nonomuraea turkmeniaca]
MTLDTRRTLWFRELDPRCYLCGYKFTAGARDRFLRRSRSPLTPPPLVDFTRPRTKERHLLIEIDHMQAVAEGGTNELDNLSLACGWCNIVKGRRGSIFDVDSRPIGMLDHPTLGWLSVPQPMWVLRIVSMRGRCEHPSGCSANLANSELLVAPYSSRGALNPANTLVFCGEHDPWKDERLISRTLVV